MSTPATKPLTPRQIEALRYLAADPSNPPHPDPVEAGTLGMLRRRGLVGRTVERRGKRQRTLSPLTDAGHALLASLDALQAPTPTWSVLLDDLLWEPGGDSRRHFRRTFPGATAAEAHAAARVWCEEEGGCEPMGVEEVEGPVDP